MVNLFHQRLHQTALTKMKFFVVSTSELMEAIDQVERHGTHLALGYSSMWSYLTVGLNMSETHAHQFISVTRKIREVPALKVAIQSGEISLPKAALIVPELKFENQNTWLEIGKLKTRVIKEELVKANPKSCPQERIVPRTAELSLLSAGFTKEEVAKIQRAQDILSQKNKRPARLAESIMAGIDLFLDRHDKVRKSEKLLCPTKVKPIPQGRVTLPAWIQHRVNTASQGQCCAKLPNGSRCPERRFLEVHHRRPLSQGGSNAPENLIHLCWGHHRSQHATSQRGGLVAAPYNANAQPNLPRRSEDPPHTKI